jgi:hypothetical protein
MTSLTGSGGCTAGKLPRTSGVSGKPAGEVRMYKKQMKCQKAVCLLCMISSVIVFLYALGIMTDLYDSLYSTMMNPADLTQTTVPGSIVYYNMQEFNSVFLKYSIGLILLACLLYITNTHIRRKYYIGNYVAAALFVIANVNVAVWAHQYIEVFKAQFLNVDFEALKKHAELWKTTYTESTFWFDIHAAVFAIALIASAALVGVVLWKVSLMKEEQKLIEAGRKAA